MRNKKLFILTTLLMLLSVASSTILSVAGPPDSNWDRSSLSVSAHCDGPVAVFTISNTGDPGEGDMDGPSSYRSFLGGLQSGGGNVQLPGGNSMEIRIDSYGVEAEVQADQRPGHPGSSQPNAKITCGEPTEEVTPEPTEEVTPEPTEEVTPEPTEEVTPEPTEEVTPEPTEEVTPEVTPEPTEEVTPQPTEEVTPEPTEEVSPEETPEITPDVTPEPTEEVTPEVTSEPTAEVTPVEPVFAALSITKDVDQASVAAGQNVNFTVVVSNTSANTATDVTLTDPVPGYMQFNSVSPSSGTCDLGGSCQLGDIAPGGSVSIAINAKVLDATAITNTATADASNADPVQDSASVNGVCQGAENFFLSGYINHSYQQNVETTAYGYVTNTSEFCEFSVGMASYRKYIEQYHGDMQWLDSQVLHDGIDGVPISPNSTETLSVLVPGCAPQIDLFWGHLIQNISEYNRYGNRLIAAAHPQHDGLCAYDPVCVVTLAGVQGDFTRPLGGDTSDTILVTLENVTEPVSFNWQLRFPTDSGRSLSDPHTTGSGVINPGDPMPYQIPINYPPTVDGAGGWGKPDQFGTYESHVNLWIADPCDDVAWDRWWKAPYETDTAIVKSATSQVVVGDTIDYALTVTNNGPWGAQGQVTVTDTLPAEVDPSTVVFNNTSGGNCAVAGDVVTCTWGTLDNFSVTLAPGQVFTVEFSVQAVQTGEAQNCVAVSAQRPNDVDMTNNQSCDTTTIISQPEPVRPVLECIADDGDGAFTAYFGYNNGNSFNVNIPLGDNNKFNPTPQDRGQPTYFLPGRQVSIYHVPMTAGQSLIWTLDGATSSASVGADGSINPANMCRPPVEPVLECQSLDNGTVTFAWSTLPFSYHENIDVAWGGGSSTVLPAPNETVPTVFSPAGNNGTFSFPFNGTDFDVTFSIVTPYNLGNPRSATASTTECDIPVTPTMTPPPTEIPTETPPTETPTGTPTDTPQGDPSPTPQLVTILPLLGAPRGSGTCPDWIVYQSNFTGSYEVYRLGDIPGLDADVNLSQGGPDVDSVQPNRAPNYNWVTFTTNRDEQWEIYIAAVDNSVIRRMTFDGSNYTPIWSPLDDYIVYEHGDGNRDLRLINLMTGQVVPLISWESNDIYPSWHPDGKHVLFQSDLTGTPQIYEVNIETLEVRLVSQDPNMADLQPIYSPDGSKIAFVSYRDGGNSAVYVMDPDGSNVELVSDASAESRRPTWSDDSSLIAYESYLTGELEVYVYQLATGGTRQMTDGGTNFSPVWMCESPTIVWTSNIKGNHNIYLSNALPINAAPVRMTNNEASQLTDTPGQDEYPAS